MVYRIELRKKEFHNPSELAIEEKRNDKGVSERSQYPSPLLHIWGVLRKSEVSD